MVVKFALGLTNDELSEKLVAVVDSPPHAFNLRAATLRFDCKCFNQVETCDGGQSAASLDDIEMGTPEY